MSTLTFHTATCDDCEKQDGLGTATMASADPNQVHQWAMRHSFATHHRLTLGTKEVETR